MLVSVNKSRAQCAGAQVLHGSVGEACWQRIPHKQNLSLVLHQVLCHGVVGIHRKNCAFVYFHAWLLSPKMPNIG